MTQAQARHRAHGIITVTVTVTVTRMPWQSDRMTMAARLPVSQCDLDDIRTIGRRPSRGLAS